MKNQTLFSNGSRDDIRKLFIVCNKIRENTTFVELTINDIYRVSLRSGILSSHVETGKRAFNEIAKQIARSSKAMEAELQHIKSLGTEISNLSLDCMKRYHQRKKILEARELGCGQNDYVLVDAVERIDQIIYLNVDKIEERCSQIILINDHLIQQCRKLWNLSVNLKMEASLSGEDEEMFFFSIADDVSKSSEKLKEQGGIYKHLVDDCKQIRNDLMKASGDLKNAA